MGNVTGYTDSVMGRWQFTPDTLNRLSSALNTAASSLSPQFASNIGCWSYDAFGNRTLEAMSTTPCANNPTPASWANYDTNNRFTTTNQAPGGAGYDAAGNVTYDGVNKYFYDTDGRICASQHIPVLGTTVMTGYLYDAEGRRIAKGTITNWGSCDPAVNGFQVMTEHDYILDLGGEQFTEMVMDANNSMGWQHTNVWAGGKLLATYDNDGLHFYFDDPLGTRRAQTDYAGVIEKTCASLPYGDGETCQPTPTEHLFTGKERDSESGNDYFGARYYASSMGRFLSPDWSAKITPVPYATMGDPQSLNLYAYVRNNPLFMVDTDGHGWWKDFGQGLADSTYRPIVSIAKNPKAAAVGLGYAVTHPGTSLPAMGNAIKNTVVAAAHGDGRAIGQIVGTGITAAATAGAVGGAVRGIGALSAAISGSEAGIGEATVTTTATYFHYGYLSDAEKFAGGLRAGSYATTEGGLTGAEAQSTLALPHPTVPDAVYPVTPEAGTPINGPSTVQPQFGQPGGGQELTFPQGTGPGSVGTPTPIPPQ